MKNETKEQVEIKIMEAIRQIPAESPLAKQINNYGQYTIPDIVDEILSKKKNKNETS